ncbi:HAD family hydrolase [Reyranella sp.]|uniref:HAD family hydrolase n=1 Tax=Reyranella sp. TaxID=1929291 RepID=UPI003D11D8EB
MFPQANPPHAVIFDVDGTLLDSVDLHAKAWVDAFSDYGHRVSFDDVRRQIGKGGDQLLPVFLNPGEIEASGEALQAHRGDILKRRYLPLMKPFAGVRLLLERVHDAGIQVALASSANRDELNSYKKILDIVDLIDVETSADDAERSKPHPDIFQAVAKRLEGTSRRHMIAIGDTPYDAEAAGKADIATIGVLCGGWAEDELRQAGCIAIYKDPADLLASFDSWQGIGQ